MVPLALGTQTGGSVIRPAAYCGVAATSRASAAINRAGLKSVSESLDTIGVFGRDIEDLVLAQHVLTGRALPGDRRRASRASACAARRAGATRIRPRRPTSSTPRRRLAKAGAQRQRVRAAGRSQRAVRPPAAVMGFESARALAWEYTNYPGQISATLRPRLEDGWTRDARGVRRDARHARDCRRALADTLREVDFLLTPCAPGGAPATLATTGDPVFNRAWTLFGVPCVTLPFGAAPNGLPLGVQLVGALDDDMRLLAWAQWAEKALK